MNITKENVDALNAVVTVEISTEDYRGKVDQILQDYRKKADVPGFRKGHVPMGMIRKQYEKSVMIDEVNKLLQESLNNYLVEEKLDILGNPLPKVQEDFSWDADNYAFEFELGLAPEFEVSLDSKKAITQYNIVADDELLDKEVENLQKRFGKIITQEAVEENSNIAVTFVNEEKEINKKSTIELGSIRTKTNQKKFIGQKVGDVVEVKTKGLFDDEHKLMGALGLSHDDIHGLDIVVSATIEEKIKEDAEKQFQTQADQQLLNAITEYLIDNTKFDLPAEFLKKWLAVAGEKPMTAEEAGAEYDKSEKGLRYQLIEGKVLKDNELQISFDDLKEYTKGFVKAQMAQYGQMNPEEKELDDIAQRVLSNQEEAKRLQEQLVSQKLLEFYKENMTFKVKEVNYEKFVKEVYK
jgi:trigger factor